MRRHRVFIKAQSTQRGANLPVIAERAASAAGAGEHVSALAALTSATVSLCTGVAFQVAVSPSQVSNVLSNIPPN